MQIVKELANHYFLGLIQEVILYGIILSSAYFLVWKKYKNRLKNWRVQFTQRADYKQIKQELHNTLLTLLIFSLYDALLFYFKDHGYTLIYTNISEYPSILAFGTFLFMIITDDTWFYWAHRTMHHPKIYRFVHAEHHKSIDVTPYSSLSFHFLESVALPLWIIPLAFLYPCICQPCCYFKYMRHLIT